MRILVTAYSCEPNMGSEPGTGWNWVKQIATRHECHLITRENNVEAIEAEAARCGLTKLVVHGFDLPLWARFWKRGQRGSSLYYYLWQLGLVRLAKRLDNQYDFEVVHHVTYVANYLPSGLAFLRKPFVWGPVGQHPRIPRAFVRRSDFRLQLGEALKASIKWLFRHADPLFRKTLQNSDLILSLSESFKHGLARSDASKVVSFTAIGVDEARHQQCQGLVRDSFEVLYSGRLIELKGVRLVLAAFAEFAQREPAARLRLIGEGPLASALMQSARRLGIESRVRFDGRVPYEEALEAMHSADVFLFPSFEGAGMVVIEAMAAGTPVICLDYGGPGDMVGEDRGIKVALGSTFNDTARGLGDALSQLRSDASLRCRINRTALAWINEHMTWDAKGEQLDRFYTRAIEHRKGRAA